MATGGSEEDTCPMCLEVFRNPKFLQCHHTLCESCIEDLAQRHSGGTFPCPSCRKETSLPPGGAAALQSNFYIKTQPPQQKTGAQDMCQIHQDKKLELYCVKCDEALCLNCKLTRHEQHQTDDLTSAISRKKKNLQADQQRLQNAVSDVKEGVTLLQEERQSLDQKRAVVEKTIRDRRATIVAAADGQMEEELKSLQSTFTDLDKDVVNVIEEREGRKKEVSTLLQQVNNAITSGTAGDVITIAKEMRSGRGSPPAVAALTSREERPVRRPVLHCDVGTDVMIQTARDYVGRVSVTEMKETRPEVRVTERFQCAQDPNVEVFSLCHEDRDPPRVIVSYEWCGMRENCPVKGFSETGKCVFTGSGNQVGKVSYKRYAKGECMCPLPQSGRFKTHCKSPTAAHLRLTNNLSGEADVDRVTVTSTDPWKTESKTEFTIEVGPHRAFDVDHTERYFAVVEEAVPKSSPRRSVRLYRRSERSAVSTYTPPCEHFLPSDVCFYQLGGQEVLLVADQLNDAIHVVTIQGKELSLQPAARNLSHPENWPGSPASLILLVYLCQDITNVFHHNDAGDSKWRLTKVPLSSSKFFTKVYCSASVSCKRKRFSHYSNFSS